MGEDCSGKTVEHRRYNKENMELEMMQENRCVFIIELHFPNQNIYPLVSKSF